MMRSLISASFGVLLMVCSAAAQGVELVYKWDLGAEHGSVLTIETRDQEQPPKDARAPERRRAAPAPNQAEPLQRSQRQEFDLSHRVVEIGADGAATTVATIRRVQIDAQLADGGRFVFDSMNPAGAKGLAEGQEARLSSLVGREIRFVVERRGRVRTAEGLEALSGAMAAPLEADGLGALVVAARGMASNDAMKQALGGSMSLLPPEPVMLGSTWETNLEQPIPGIGSAHSTWRTRLERFERGPNGRVAVLASSAAIDVRNDDPASPIAALLKIEEAGGRATTRFNVDQGVAQRTEMELWAEMQTPEALAEALGGTNEGSRRLVTRMTHELTNLHRGSRRSSPERRTPDR